MMKHILAGLLALLWLPAAQAINEADLLPVHNPLTLFGFPKTGWKPWQLFDGTPVLVPAAFNTEADANGDLLMYPEGDRGAPPSARMPRGASISK